MISDLSSLAVVIDGGKWVELQRLVVSSEAIILKVFRWSSAGMEMYK